MTGVIPANRMRQVQPLQTAEAPSDWTLFKQHWVEPYRLDLVAVFVLMIVLVLAARRLRPPR